MFWAAVRKGSFKSSTVISGRGSVDRGGGAGAATFSGAAGSGGGDVASAGVDERGGREVRGPEGSGRVEDSEREERSGRGE